MATKAPQYKRKSGKRTSKPAARERGSMPMSPTGAKSKLPHTMC